MTMWSKTIKKEELVTLNGRNKIQIVNIQLIQFVNYFEIHRITGQLGGKQTIQPIITISAGKAKRTPIQQAELEFNSHLKKYLDKGYKKITDLSEKSLDELLESEIQDFLGAHKTDSNGVVKPMLALQSEKCSNKAFEKEWYCSRKLDGVRCLMYYKDGEIYSASRGGGEYNIPTTLIRQNNTLLEWFKEHPDCILDGELYSHGVPLQKLSGISRLETWEERCEILEYWIYDIVSDKPFEKRLNTLNELKELLESKDFDRVKVIDHYKLSGWTIIKKQHDLFVKEGYEGLVMRNPDKEYGIGKRSALYMIKVKDYKDDTFTVVDWVSGLRPIEDMCFVLALHGHENDDVFNDKNSFKAKPMGTRATKEEFIENMDSLIRQKADVKYFNYSEDGIPVQPTFKAFRYDL